MPKLRCWAVRMAWTLPVLLGLTACGGDRLYSNDYRCQFQFDLSVHNNTLLNQVVNPLVPGTFVHVSLRWQGGVRHIDLRLASGTAESVALTTAEERQRACILGADNGIVVGQSYHNGLLAYDAQCPNCLAESGQTGRPLAFAAAGARLACPRCRRAYSLHDHGAVVEGPAGKKLMEYVAQSTGRFLLVHNKY